MDVHKVQLKSDTHTNVYENIYKIQLHQSATSKRAL